jgi:hypothetical protein
MRGFFDGSDEIFLLCKIAACCFVLVMRWYVVFVDIVHYMTVELEYWHFILLW